MSVHPQHTKIYNQRGLHCQKTEGLLTEASCLSKGPVTLGLKKSEQNKPRALKLPVRLSGSVNLIPAYF